MVRDAWVFFTGRGDSELARQTKRLQFEAAKLRALRVAQQQVVEETALEHVRRVVGEMQQLKQQLDGMEEAAKALAESVAEQAKARMQQEEEEDD
ncbi:unnamed protein product, partial [Closterium sp. Yama58-4]